MTTQNDAEKASVTGQATGTTSAAPSLPEDMIIILPVRNMVLFPGVILPVAIKREKTVAGAQEAVRTEGKVGFLLQKDPQTEDPTLDELYRIGTAASIVRYITAPDGTHHLVCQGERRFRVLDTVSGFPYLVARVEYLNDSGVTHPEVEARTLLLKQKAVEAISLLPQAPAELGNSIQAIESASTLADTISSFLDVKPAEKQEILETTDVRQRLERVATYLTRRVEVLKLSRQIEEQTKEAIDDRQREFVLRADEADPEGARRRKRRRGNQRTRRSDHQGGDAARSRGAHAQGAAPPRAHERGERRVFHGAHLPRHADRAALVEARQ